MTSEAGTTRANGNGLDERDTRPTSGRVAEPLDGDDPRVAAARRAERAAYDHYGLDHTEHFVYVPELECRVRVAEIGSGPPVVVVPGGVGYGVIWPPLLAELDGYRLLVVDRPGSGLSDGIDHRRMPLARIAATSTGAVFDHFDIETAPLVGNSMGGLWSLRFALERPDRVSAIALLGCPALYPGTSAPFPMRLLSLPIVGGRLVGPLMRADDADDARETLEFLGHPPETATRLPETFAEAWYRVEQVPHFERSWTTLLRQAVRVRGAVPEAAFTPEDLRSVRTPTLVVWGSDDPFGTLETGRRGTEQFPDATFHEVGTGHLPWLDEPIRCGELVREFLDRHG